MDIKDAYIVLDEIMDTGGLTDKMRDAVKDLKDSLDARYGELDRYKEQYDGEKAEWEKERESLINNYNELDQRFRDAKDRWLERMLTPSEALRAHEKDAKSGDIENMEEQKEKEIKFYTQEEVIK